MTENVDTLAEACRVAGVVAGEEAEIETIEAQIASKFREVCKKIFSSARFRLPTHRVGVYALDSTPHPAGEEVWQEIGAVLEDRIEWDGDFHGSARTLRITTDGRILAVWQWVPKCRAYNLFAGGDYAYPPELDHWQAVQPASDHEIAGKAVELASDLLTALRRRIDTAKEEKAELRRIAGLGKEKEGGVNDEVATV